MTPPIAEPTRIPARAGSIAFDSGVGPGFARGCDGEHDVPLEPARILRADDGLRRESLHFGRDANGKLARIECADPVDAATTCDGGVPGRLRVEPQRRDRSESGYHDAPH